MGFFELFAGALAMLYGLVPSYGVAIILLTVLVRLILLPLSIKQTRSMREMQKIQPEVKKLQQKHKGDRQKMNEELMALYKEHGVNPFGGCLPLLLQMPVFIALYRVLLQPLSYLGFKDMDGGSGVEWVAQKASGVMASLQDSELAHGLLTMPKELNRFLGIHLDCTPSTALNQDLTCGGGLVTALPYLLLVAVMGWTTYYQQKQMQSSNTNQDPQAQQMQMFAKIMPVMLMVFAFSFPAGLTIYWLTSNVWTIGQQRLMMRAYPPPTAGDGNAPGKKKGAAKPETGKPPKKEGDKPRSGKTPRPQPTSKKKKKR